MLNPHLKVFRLVDTRAESGCLELAKAMYQSPSPGIKYWDISGNVMPDISLFVQALSKYRANMVSLKMNNCKLDGIDMAQLLRSLRENPHFGGLKQLGIKGNSLNSSNSHLFAEFLGHLEEPVLSILEIGPISSPEPVMAAIAELPHQLSVLRLSETSLNDACGQSLAFAAKYLVELDLSGCSISDQAIAEILEAMDVDTTAELKLGFGKMSLRGTRLANFVAVLERFDHVRARLMGLGLDGNGLVAADLQVLTAALVGFPRLSLLSLSENFGSKPIINELAQIIRLPSIETLIVRGNKSVHMGEQTIQLLAELTNNNTIQHLDITGNEMGSRGISALCEMLRVNTTLKTLFVDGSKADIERIAEFLSTVLVHSSLLEVSYPIDDIYDCLTQMKEEKRDEASDSLAQLQAAVALRLSQNRINAGIPSPLFLLHDPVLNEVIEEISAAMARRLEGVSLNEHLAITDIVGLPLPYENEQFGVTGSASEPDSGTEGMYVNSALMATVVEPTTDVDMSCFQTLRFNSTLIQRPDAVHKLIQKSQLVAEGTLEEPLPTSMDDLFTTDAPVSPPGTPPGSPPNMKSSLLGDVLFGSD
jgi:hypothetical protein